MFATNMITKATEREKELMKKDDKKKKWKNLNLL